VSLSVQNLIWQLQQKIKEDPKNAYKDVVMSQYDSESASQNGYEPAESVREYLNKIIID
jgi:hypothetical protein